MAATNDMSTYHLSEMIREGMEDAEIDEQLATVIDDAASALDEIAAALDACQYAEQRGHPLEKRDRELRLAVEKVMANTY